MGLRLILILFFTDNLNERHKHQAARLLFGPTPRISLKLKDCTAHTCKPCQAAAYGELNPVSFLLFTCWKKPPADLHLHLCHLIVLCTGSQRERRGRWGKLLIGRNFKKTITTNQMGRRWEEASRTMRREKQSVRKWNKLFSGRQREREGERLVFVSGH